MLSEQLRLRQEILDKDPGDIFKFFQFFFIISKDLILYQNQSGTHNQRITKTFLLGRIKSSELLLESYFSLDTIAFQLNECIGKDLRMSKFVVCIRL